MFCVTCKTVMIIRSVAQPWALVFMLSIFIHIQPCISLKQIIEHVQQSVMVLNVARSELFTVMNCRTDNPHTDI